MKYEKIFVSLFGAGWNYFEEILFDILVFIYSIFLYWRISLKIEIFPVKGIMKWYNYNHGRKYVRPKVIRKCSSRVLQS